MRLRIYKLLCQYIGRNKYAQDNDLSMLKSKTSIARPKSKSLRATIPEGIAEFLELKPGDTLEWSMENAGNERIATVKKSKT
jgi:hypothetical protein